MTVYQFLLSIAESLGDAQPGRAFKRYPLATLVLYYNEAMCFVASKRPDLFTDYKIMKLAPGTDQDARCCGCTSVIGLVSQVDLDGNVIKNLSENGSVRSKTERWYRPACRTPNAVINGPLLTGYTLVTGMSGRFTVSPPVPVGAEVYVKLKCVHAPVNFSLERVMSVDDTAMTGNCKFLPALRSYVLYRALMGDRHATGADAQAKAELRNAYDYLDVQMRSEKEQETS